MSASSATSKDSNVTVDHWLKKISWGKTTMFAIEKKIPEMVIEMRSRYPFSDLDVGDSILITEAQKAESARVTAI